jgi:hypothetical protein
VCFSGITVEVSKYVLHKLFPWLCVCFQALNLRIPITLLLSSNYNSLFVILDKPVLVPNKTLLQLKTEILKPVSVSLTVKSKD